MIIGSFLADDNATYFYYLVKIA